MDILETDSPEIQKNHRTLQVIEYMKQKGVQQSLLQGLSQDSGFAQFCVEWTCGRCGTEDNYSSISDQSRIRDLRERINYFKSMIAKTKHLLHLAIERCTVQEVNDLELKLMKAKELPIFGEMPEQNYAKIMRIKTYNYQDTKLMTRYKFNIPKCNQLNLAFTRRKVGLIKAFLEKKFPDQVETCFFLRLESNSFAPKMTKFGFIFRDLQKISSKIAQCILLDKFQISQKQLKRIFVLFKNKNLIHLKQCELELDTVPNFSRALEKCELKGLNIEEYWSNPNLDKDTKLNYLDNLINGLSKSEDFKNNIKTIRIRHTLFPDSSLLELFRKYQLDHILFY
ncbi:unnamed protein product [Moneuplotes crassus]|uniref:Uncharacterized protein n=1 Tax=Euplotes crassus TaxID=5936 RepID=A0AAD2CYK0_EUPCR|nr:unnamed protein product [Moneuplotes crassus]